jgi:hypothetical protein
MNQKDQIQYFFEHYFCDFLDTRIIVTYKNNQTIYLDTYAEDIFYQLKLKYQPYSYTYGEKLSDQMRIFSSVMYDSFISAIQHRMETNDK